MYLEHTSPGQLGRDNTPVEEIDQRLIDLLANLTAIILDDRVSGQRLLHEDADLRVIEGTDLILGPNGVNKPIIY